MKSLMVDLKMLFWLIVWAVLVLSLVLNPLLRDHWYWYQYWYSYEYFAGFAFILLSLILVQMRFKKISLSIALASSYFVVVVVITIWLHLFPVEHRLDMGGVYFLGYPSTRLTLGVNNFLDGLFYMGDRVIAQGISLVILGCTQYFLIGFILEKIYKAIIHKVKK